MTPHESVQPLLALSAAGLLEADQERAVRQHVRECAVCAAALAELGELGAAIGGLPAPEPSDALVARTQACLAAEVAAATGQRRNALLAVGLALFAWATAWATWAIWRVLTEAAAAVLAIDPSGVFAWLVLTGLTALMAAPTAAALAAVRRRKEGNCL
jgi:hypothetical protein